MKKIIKIVTVPLKMLFLACIYFYKCCISPLLQNVCIYKPTCSTYTLTAIKRFGAVKGCILGMKRILRCSPKHCGGIDRVPEDLKGEFKWLI